MKRHITRSDWRDSLDRYEARLARYTAPGSAPRGLVRMHDWLICYGLMHGWLELTAEGALV